MKHKTRQYYMVTALILVGVAIYQMPHITGPTMFPDEFGYWANAVRMLGYDWSDVVSLQSYYSFGYSFLLVPLLKMFSNPFVMYRAAVALNLVFVYLHAVLLWKIADRLHPEKRTYNLFFCMPAAFYPNLIFNMQLSWTECLLPLLFIGSVWLLLCYDRTKQLRYALLFTVCLLYQYFVHMRSLGVLAAGILTLFITWLCGGERSLKRTALWTIGIALCLAAGMLFKEALQNGLYAKVEEGLLNGNDFVGQLGKLQRLLSIDGIVDFVMSCVGKLFYLGIATCGTVYFGVWRVMQRVKKSPVFLYLLSAACFTFGITALYLMGGGRGDSYLYGRYNEFLIPVFVYLGLLEMCESKYTVRMTAGIIALQGGMAYALVPVMAGADPSRFQGYFTVGLSYVLQEYMPKMQDYVILPYIAGSIALVLLSLVQGLFIRKKKWMIVYLLPFFGLYLYTAVSAGEKYLYDHSIDSGADLALAQQVKALADREDTIVFINSYSEVQYVDSIQFGLQEHPLCVVAEKDFTSLPQDKPEFIFTYKSSQAQDLLRQNYDTVMSTWHFNLYFDK